jgi:hypothetical protein
MTLEELLALLPDNETGQIGADDLRTVTTELWTKIEDLGHLVARSAPFKWTTAATPGDGQMKTNDGTWSTSPTTLLVSRVAASLGNPPWDWVQQALQVGSVIRVRNTLTTPLDNMTGEVTGALVIQPTYITIPVSITSAAGTVPTNNKAVAIDILQEVST